MKIHNHKIKKVEYFNKKLYVFNNIDKEKLDENSDFLLASITKIFTIISLLILHQENIININKTFKNYLDHKELKNVKIIDVMNHTSGMKNNSEKYINSIKNYKNIKNENLIKHKKGKFIYSNLGYMILGVLIEKVSDLSYRDYVIKKILKPLKMNNSGFENPITTHYTSNFKKLTKKQKNERFNSISDGGMKSSINDLIKFRKFPNLIENKSLLKEIYIFYEDKYYFIGHNGNTTGIMSNLIIKYDKNWKFQDIQIEFNTIKTF